MVRRPFAREELGEKKIEFVVHETYVGKCPPEYNVAAARPVPIEQVFVGVSTEDSDIEDIDPTDPSYLDCSDEEDHVKGEF